MVAKGDYHFNRETLKNKFSEKEIAIIKLICQEYSNKQIAHLSCFPRFF